MSWVEQVKAKIRILEAQRDTAFRLAQAGDRDWRKIVAPYTGLIRRLETGEMPLARELDERERS